MSAAGIRAKLAVFSNIDVDVDNDPLANAIATGKLSELAKELELENEFILWLAYVDAALHAPETPRQIRRGALALGKNVLLSMGAERAVSPDEAQRFRSVVNRYRPWGAL